MASKKQKKSLSERKKEMASNSHRAFMPKAGGIVWFQSYLEFLIALWFESRQDIVSAIPHGFVIDERIGRRKKWTLDSLVGFRGGYREIVEIKPTIELREDSDGNMSPAGWDDLRAWSAANGEQPAFYTDQIVNENAQLLSNWLRIRPYLQLAHQMPDPKLDDLIEVLVDQATQISIASIVSQLPSINPQDIITHVLHLLHAGRLFSNLESEVLSENTWFRVNELVNPISLPEKGPLDGPFPYLISNPISTVRTSDPNSWEPLPAALIPTKERESYAKRKAIVSARLIEGVSARNVAQRFDVSVGEVYRLIKRCRTKGPNGEPWGWVGLIPNQQLVPRAYDPSRTGGVSGALSRLWARFPELKVEVEDRFLNRNQQAQDREVAIPHLAVWDYFLKECRRLGVAPDEWPLCAEKQGKESLRVHLNKLRASEFDAYTSGRFGVLAKQLLGARGMKNNARIVRPYATVQIDGERIDAETAISVQAPDGSFINLPAGRGWLLVAICVGSGAVLGWSITPMEQYDSIDLLDCVLACLEPWSMRSDSIVSDQYKVGAGLPSGVLDKCRWRSFDVLQLDNALPHISVENQERIIETISCLIHTGLPKTPTGRVFIERMIGTIARRSSQRIQSTTGSNPQDPRNLGASTQAVKYSITLKHIEDLTDVTVCNLNVKPSTAITGRSPMEYIAAWNLKESIFCRYVPLIIQENMPLHLRHISAVSIAGNVDKQFPGYIEWKYCRYKNERIVEDASLIGSKVNLLVDVRDVRTIQVYSLSGEYLGEAVAQDRWRLRKHSLKERLMIGRWMKAQVNLPESSDPVGVFRTRTAALAREDKKARRKYVQDQTENDGPNSETEATTSSDAPSDPKIDNPVSAPQSPKRLTHKWVSIRSTLIR